MGLFDRFTKPKWQSDNWEIRLKAVEKLDDQNILTEIAINDEKAPVREKALNKISDKETFNRLLVKEKEEYLQVKYALKDDVTDERVLAEIVKRMRIQHDDKREAILDKIQNQEILADISKNARIAEKHEFNAFPGKRQTGLLALNRITDEKILEDIALTAENTEIRNIAVLRLKDEEILYHIGLNDEDYKIRENAMEKISDEKLLCEIAKNNADEGIRRNAVEKVHDQETLKYVVENDDNEFVRENAVRNITNEELLIDIALNGNESIRRIAVGNPNLTNQEVLKKIVLNDEVRVSSVAINKISDTTSFSENELRNLYFKNPDKKKVYTSHKDIRLFAVKRITDEDLLFDIANNYNEKIPIRIAAVENPNFKDESRLIELTKWGYEVVCAVIQKLTDKDTLVKLSQDDYEKGESVWHPELDMSEVIKTGEYPIREAANKRLKELGYA